MWLNYHLTLAFPCCYPFWRSLWPQKVSGQIVVVLGFYNSSLKDRNFLKTFVIGQRACQSDRCVRFARKDDNKVTASTLLNLGGIEQRFWEWDWTGTKSVSYCADKLSWQPYGGVIISAVIEHELRPNDRNRSIDIESLGTFETTIASVNGCRSLLYRVPKLWGSHRASQGFASLFFTNVQQISDPFNLHYFCELSFDYSGQKVFWSFFRRWFSKE